MVSHLHKDIIVNAIRVLRARRVRPSLKKISWLVKREHSLSEKTLLALIEALVDSKDILRVHFKGAISYRIPPTSVGVSLEDSFEDSLDFISPSSRRETSGSETEETNDPFMNKPCSDFTGSDFAAMNRSFNKPRRGGRGGSAPKPRLHAGPQVRIEDDGQYKLGGSSAISETINRVLSSNGGDTPCTPKSGRSTPTLCSSEGDCNEVECIEVEPPIGPVRTQRGAARRGRPPLSSIGPAETRRGRPPSARPKRAKRVFDPSEGGIVELNTTNPTPSALGIPPPPPPPPHLPQDYSNITPSTTLTTNGTALGLTSTNTPSCLYTNTGRHNNNGILSTPFNNNNFNSIAGKRRNTVDGCGSSGYINNCNTGRGGGRAGSAGGVGGGGGGRGRSGSHGSTCDICHEVRPHGLAEEYLLLCCNCPATGHPSCLGYSAGLAERSRLQPWTCMDCKHCAVCSMDHLIGTLIFCDECDRAYHLTCHQPALTTQPQGSWVCCCCRPRAAPATAIYGGGVDGVGGLNDGLPLTPRDSPVPEDIQGGVRIPSCDPTVPNAAQWTVESVVKHFEDKGFTQEAHVFIDQVLDGAAVLLLSRSDVLSGLGLKLGPALKMYRQVRILQTRLASPPMPY